MVGHGLQTTPSAVVSEQASSEPAFRGAHAMELYAGHSSFLDLRGPAFLICCHGVHAQPSYLSKADVVNWLASMLLTQSCDTLQLLKPNAEHSAKQSTDV